MISLTHALRLFYFESTFIWSKFNIGMVAMTENRSLLGCLISTRIVLFETKSKLAYIPSHWLYCTYITCLTSCCLAFMGHLWHILQSNYIYICITTRHYRKSLKKYDFFFDGIITSALCAWKVNFIAHEIGICMLCLPGKSYSAAYSVWYELMGIRKIC